MRFIRLFSCLMALIFSCTLFADENTSFCEEPIEGRGRLETVFILRSDVNTLDNRILITENGELYIKMDENSTLTETEENFIRNQLVSFQNCSFEQYQVEICRHIIGNDYQKGWRCTRCLVINSAGRTSCWLCHQPR